MTKLKSEIKTNLLEVIDVLRSVPDEQFNMEHWWLEDGRAFDDDRNIMYKVADGPCGCVVGHLIQRGLLSGEVLKPKDVPSGSLPYQYSDAIFSQISDALKLYNKGIAEFLFSQYAYFRPRANITQQDVVCRIEYIITEIDKTLM